MLDDTARKAINYALQENWEEAILWNKRILEKNPEDIEALVRCARAHFEMGTPKEAKELLEVALKIDSLHPIANKMLRNLSELSAAKSRESLNGNGVKKMQVFLEEPGRTKVVSLLNLAGKNTISKLRCGDMTQLQPRGHKISVMTIQNDYIGRLPDDLASRLLQYMVKGNKYEAYVRTVSPTEIKIFLKEVYRCAELANTVSFQTLRVKRN